MIVTVFRTRMNPGMQDEYGPMASRMSELVRANPGYISHKGFVAEDGERVTIVEFESARESDLSKAI
jgi:antibiotic biosynthesis monooxygenase (ABM) superfamily enzyme